MPSNRYIKSKLNQLKEIPGGLVESMSRSGPPRAAVAPPERVPDMLHRTPRRPGALVEEYVQEQRDVDKLWPNFGSTPVRMPSPPPGSLPRASHPDWNAPPVRMPSPADPGRRKMPYPYKSNVRPVRMPSPPLPTAPRGSRSNPIYQ